MPTGIDVRPIASCGSPAPGAPLPNVRGASAGGEDDLLVRLRASLDLAIAARALGIDAPSVLRTARRGIARKGSP